MTKNTELLIQSHFVKEQYAFVHILIDYTCNMYAHDVTIFINYHFCSLHVA